MTIHLCILGRSVSIIVLCIWEGVYPLLFCAFGLLVNCFNKSTILSCPPIAAKWIGVFQRLSGELRFSAETIRASTMPRCPFQAAKWIGVMPNLLAALQLMRDTFVFKLRKMSSAMWWSPGLFNMVSIIFFDRSGP